MIKKQQKLYAKKMTGYSYRDKLWNGIGLVDKLSKLVTIFETPALEFSNNLAVDDYSLGDF